LGIAQSNPAHYFIGIKHLDFENKEVWKLIHILTEKPAIGRLIVLGSLTIDKSVLFIVSLYYCWYYRSTHGLFLTQI
jgi:hypothetical protein